MPNWLAALLGGSAVTGLIAGIVAIFRLLLNAAIAAERKRADQWYEAWKTERQISATATGQVLGVVTKLERAAEEEAHR